MDLNNFEIFNNNNMDDDDFKKAKKNKKKGKIKCNSILLIVILFATTLISVSLCIFLLASYNAERDYTLAVMNELDSVQQESEVMYSEEEVQAMLSQKDTETSQQIQAMEEQAEIRSQEGKNQLLQEVKQLIEQGEGMLTLLQTLYPEYVIAPADGQYHFFPIVDSLNKNNFDLSKFTYPIENIETGKYEGSAGYITENNTEAKRGVDVSTFQGDIDWKKVKNAGMDFAIIRLGFRGYESGKLVLDTNYEDNIKESIEAGLDTGVYFFTEAVTEKEAIEEADFIIENLEGHKITMPVVIDVEESADPEKTRTKDLTPEQRTKNVIAFCQRIQEAGYQSMIYGNLQSFMVMMNFDQLEQYDKWFAYYRYPFHFPYKIKMWQYTSTEKVDGIKGDVDVNLMFY